MTSWGGVPQIPFHVSRRKLSSGLKPTPIAEQNRTLHPTAHAWARHLFSLGSVWGWSCISFLQACAFLIPLMYKAMGDALNCLKNSCNGRWDVRLPLPERVLQELHLLHCLHLHPWSMDIQCAQLSGGCWKPASQLCISNGMQLTFIERLPNGRW